MWLEEGSADSGLQHILNPRRVAEFEQFGIARPDIVHVVWKAVTQGEPIGVSGKDRTVYEVEHDRRTCRIAVTVGSNGYIIGANPISADRKLKPYHERKP